MNWKSSMIRKIGEQWRVGESSYKGKPSKPTLRSDLVQNILFYFQTSSFFTSN